MHSSRIQIGDTLLENVSRAADIPQSTYVPLSVETVSVYLEGVPAVTVLMDAGTTLDCREIGDGNLNLVFVAQAHHDSSRSVILKQALPYLRCAGDGWPLSRERAEFEYMALQLGIAHVYDIASIEDPRARAVAERLALHIGERFVLERHQAHCIDDMLDIIRSTPTAGEREGLKI